MEPTTHALRPWGLTRMEPYPKLHAAATAVALDPASQTAVFRDPHGRPVEMGKHGTGTGTETKTQTSQGDGSGPANSDEGQDQDSDQD
ncbi:putative ATP-grasp-modified RiPP [Streptomyces sp. NPDC002787]